MRMSWTPSSPCRTISSMLILTSFMRWHPSSRYMSSRNFWMFRSSFCEMRCGHGVVSLDEGC